MKVQDILKGKGDNVKTIRPDAVVSMAVHALTTEGIGALVVSADGERLTGVISERDIVRGLARHGGRLLEMRVREAMSTSVPTCRPDDNLVAVMAQMTQTRNRHLPVVENGRIQGIVSIGDVIKNRLEELELEAAVLRSTWLAHH